MANLLRTTITIPKDLLKRAKLTAVAEEKSLSEFVREALEERLVSERPRFSKKEFLSLAGSIKSGSPMFKNPREYVEKLRAVSDD